MLLTLGGLGIWDLVDAFLISGMLRANRRNVEHEVLHEIAAMRETIYRLLSLGIGRVVLGTAAVAEKM